MVDKGRPKFGHPALLALSTEISEQAIWIEKPEPLVVDDANSQQPDRQVSAVNPLLIIVTSVSVIVWPSGQPKMSAPLQAITIAKPTAATAWRAIIFNAHRAETSRATVNAVTRHGNSTPAR